MVKLALAPIRAVFEVFPQTQTAMSFTNAGSSKHGNPTRRFRRLEIQSELRALADKVFKLFVIVGFEIHPICPNLCIYGQFLRWLYRYFGQCAFH